MGFKCEINYILRLRQSQGLSQTDLIPGKSFNFNKDGHRIYPVDVPIDLANEAWEIIGRVVVREITVGKGRTEGIYEVLLVYGETEKAILTQVNRSGESVLANMRLS